MINASLKPIEVFKREIPASEKHGKLEIIISLFDQPVAMTGTRSIHSTVEIIEDGHTQFGFFMYEAILTQDEVEQQFSSIFATPLKFKTNPVI